MVRGSRSSEGIAAAPSVFLFRSPGHHLVAAFLAILFSALLHLALVRMVPPIPVGHAPDFRSVLETPTFELRDVRRHGEHVADRPAAFRPERPDEFVDLSIQADAIRDALQGLEPEQPVIDNTPLAGADGALAPPAPASGRDAWEPRQEILAIEEEIFSRDISLLPRRYVDAAPRRARAPDITLPVELPDADALARAGTAMEAADTSLPAGDFWSPYRPERSAGHSGMDGIAGSGPLALAGPSKLLDEEVSEITPVTPIEHLLRLDLQAWSPDDEPGVRYFKLEIHRAGAESLPILPRDILLIQDCSESMTQRKLDRCKEGMHAWLDRLRPEDRFDLMGFRDEAYRCFDGWTNLTAATRARANWFIRSMTSRGKTDVYASLKALLSVERSPDRPVLAVLITDGKPTAGIVDSSDIIAGFTRENDGAVSVFAFGGGQRVNRFLLDFLSYKNRGDSQVVNERDAIPEGLTHWAEELGRPVLTGLRYRFAGIDETDIYPRTLTHLFLDRPLVIYGRVTAADPQVAFQVLGRSGARERDMVFTLPWSGAARGDGRLRTEWVWHKVYHLIGEHIRTGEEGIMDQLRAMARQYGLAVPYGGEYPVR